MEDSIPNFDCGGDVSSVGQRWIKWKRAFDLFIKVKDITDEKRKRAMLLHYGGMQMQDIYFTLPGIENEENDTYEKAIKALDGYFLPRTNIPFERHIFRSLKQGEQESIDQFVTRLRKQAASCDFTNLEEELRDQVINKCYSNQLRRKFLERRNIQLLELIDVAKSFEAVNLQAASMEGAFKEINRIEQSKEKGGKTREQVKARHDSTCYRCGFRGHKSTDSGCPALDKTCRRCGKKGHYQKCCKTKIQNKNVLQTKPSFEGSREKERRHGRTVNSVESEKTEVETPEDVYIFGVNSKILEKKGIGCEIGGVKLEMLVDSGASCNIIDQETWEDLKTKKVKCHSAVRGGDVEIYSYGSSKPLEILGSFLAAIRVQGKEETAKVYVMKGKGIPLLGEETAKRLGILKVDLEGAVNELQLVKLLEKKCFCDKLGKLKDFQVQIPLKSDVPPVAQTYRRIPIPLQKRIEEKVQELLNLDIIEKVNGPSLWVSPVVPIMKENGDLRLCIDMRRANQAVLRERHPLPTIDDLLPNLQCGRYFSKLDIQNAFHQLELSEESRGITTFVTHTGLYRYKRLMFGIASAPEIFQKTLEQVLKGCEGTYNFIDDILVYGETETQHDERLERVIQTLEDNGFTLNRRKCAFKLKHITFLGHSISEKGIEPAEDKIKAVRNFRQPKSGEEVRSFLGLVNYVGRFIPNLSTVSEPLRALTRKNRPFRWEQEQQQAFQKLKDSLCAIQALGYFNPEDKTTLITDASPVGLGAVLIQSNREGPRVIGYASKSLTDVERRYSQTEKEALAIVWAVERFSIYLFGLKFELITDHRPLEMIFSPKSKPCARIERWVLRLQSFDYEVTYKPGQTNIADPLSRLLLPDVTKENSLSKEAENHVYFTVRESIPCALSWEEIDRESANDYELSRVRNSLTMGSWDASSRSYEIVRGELCISGNIVLRGSRIVIPKALRERTLSLAHEGHPGIVVMKQRLRSKVWWPRYDKDVERVCRECRGCQSVARPDNPEPMSRRPLPEGPWEEVAIDLMGPLPSGDHLLVVVDYYSRFVEAEVISDTTSGEIIRNLKTIFARFGYPCSITADNGKQFVGEEFRKFCSDSGIKLFNIIPYWPQANGEVERQNQSLLKRLRIAQVEKHDWKGELLNYLLMYRSTPHTVTGVSPAELLFGRPIRDKIPQLRLHNDNPRQDVRIRDATFKEKGKRYADRRRRARHSQIREGDKVLVKEARKNKLTPNFGPTPLRVVAKRGPNVTAAREDGWTVTRHVSFFKKCPE